MVDKKINIYLNDVRIQALPGSTFWEVLNFLKGKKVCLKGAAIDLIYNRQAFLFFSHNRLLQRQVAIQTSNNLLIQANKILVNADIPRLKFYSAPTSKQLIQSNNFEEDNKICNMAKIEGSCHQTQPQKNCPVKRDRDDFLYHFLL